LAAGFCPKNLAFARKMIVLPESGGAVAPPSPLARTPMAIYGDSFSESEWECSVMFISGIFLAFRNTECCRCSVIYYK